MARVEDDDELDGLNPINREADKAFAIVKQKIFGVLKHQPPEEHDGDFDSAEVAPDEED
jgi:hypothetical protein